MSTHKPIDKAKQHLEDFLEAAYDAAFWADLDQNKAQEALNRVKIHSESFISATQAVITAARYAHLV